MPNLISRTIDILATESSQLPSSLGVQALSILLVNLSEAVLTDGDEHIADSTIKEHFLNIVRRAGDFEKTGHSPYTPFILPWVIDTELSDQVIPLANRVSSLRNSLPNEPLYGSGWLGFTLNNWAYYMASLEMCKAATPMAFISVEERRYAYRLDTLALCLFQEDQSDTALELLDEAKDTEGFSAEREYHRMMILLDIDRIQEAQDVFLFIEAKAKSSIWFKKAKSLRPLLNTSGKGKTTNTDRGEPVNFSYDIAISFAGEDRNIAAKLACHLKDRGLRVFYDDFEKDRLWGKDLYSHLVTVYEKQARYCVLLVSQHYAAKRWTALERQAAQARAFASNSEYILPVRLDNTEIPGLLRTTGYLDWNREGPEGIVSCVLEKLNSHELG